jgi:hypothetical protein
MENYADHNLSEVNMVYISFPLSKTTQILLDSNSCGILENSLEFQELL